MALGRRRASTPMGTRLGTMPTRHDHDAGGDPAPLAAKAALREEVWAAMSAKGVARFPSPDGRIPNFVGAEAAARRLAGTSEWGAARTSRPTPTHPSGPYGSGPSRTARSSTWRSPVWPRTGRSSWSTRPAWRRRRGGRRRRSRAPGGRRSPWNVRRAGHGSTSSWPDASPSGATGRASVRGGGFSDLELAVARAAGMVDGRTVVATTVHERQVVDAGARLPRPTTSTSTSSSHPTRSSAAPDLAGSPAPRRCGGSELTDEKIASIPLLARLASARGR